MLLYCLFVIVINTPLKVLFKEEKTKKQYKDAVKMVLLKKLGYKVVTRKRLFIHFIQGKTWERHTWHHIVIFIV